MQRRIVNVYYSMLGEQWVHAYLRRRGVTILHHPLADTLFTDDGWFGDVVVSSSSATPSSDRRRAAERRQHAGSWPGRYLRSD